MQAELVRRCKWECCSSGLAEMHTETADGTDVHLNWGQGRTEQRRAHQALG